MRDYDEMSIEELERELRFMEKRGSDSHYKEGMLDLVKSPRWETQIYRREVKIKAALKKKKAEQKEKAYE